MPQNEIKADTKISEEVSVTSPIYQIRLSKNLGTIAKKFEKDGTPCRLHAGPDKSYFVCEPSLKYLKSQGYQFQILREIIPKEAGLKIIYPLSSILHRLPPDSVQAEVLAMALSRQEGTKVPIPIYCGRTREEIAGTFCIDLPGGKRHYRWRWDRRKRKSPARSMSDLFPKLAKRMRDPETRFVVSLGGGGLAALRPPLHLQARRGAGWQGCNR